MNRIQVNYQQNMLRAEDMKSTKTCAGNVKTLEGWRRGGGSVCHFRWLNANTKGGRQEKDE